MQPLSFSDKRLKGGDNRVIKEVKAPSEIALNGIIGPRLGFLQRYKVAEASIHIHAASCIQGKGDPEQFCAIIQYAGVDDSRKEFCVHRPSESDIITDSRSCRGMEHPVLVAVREFMNKPEGVHISLIPTVIRLHSLDDCQRVFGNAPRQSIRVYSFKISNFLDEDGEVQSIGTDSTGKRKIEQLPKQVIQSRPHVMQIIAYDDTEIWRRLFPNVQNCPDKFAIRFLDNFQGIAIEIFFDFLVEKAEMFLCPDEFELNSLK